MVTIQIHISDETAEALAAWGEIHDRSAMVLKARIGLMVAEHPDTCTNAMCPDLVQIENAKELLKNMECVSRFTHDVLGAARFAKVSA